MTGPADPLIDAVTDSDGRPGTGSPTEQRADSDIADLGESMAAIRRIFGPPGTGKTTTLAARVGATVAQHGGDGIRIASFSRTAAAEIGSRDEVKHSLPRGAVGTMHHHAYAAIENPPMALDPEIIAHWNDEVGPTWRVHGQKNGGRGFESRDRAGTGTSDLSTGDGLLEVLDFMRSSRVPSSMWPAALRTFARRWTDWKRDTGTVDFADMIIHAYQRARDGEAMPGNPHLIVIDEAQDMTRAEIMLALEWGRRLDPQSGRLVFALDDDQAIMEWRGGDPRRILELDLSEWQSEVLAQSYRVPPAVHAVAERWVRRCSVRFPKRYQPRPPAEQNDASPRHSHGWAQRVPYHLHSSELLDQIEADLADPDLADFPQNAVMVIASCGYMLEPLLKGMRERGLPFHNPFREAEGSWNPLGNPGRGTSTAQRIYRYSVVRGADMGSAARRWTGEDMRLWTEIVSVREAQFVHGAGAHLLKNLPDGEVPDELLLSLWRDSEEGDEALARATRGDLDWLASVITDKKRRHAAAFPLQVARTRGPAALAAAPRVVPGTIHSTKGAQASRVYLAPDLSAAGARQWEAGAGQRDQLYRLFYVGATRAYHGLSVLAPAGGYSVPVDELIPGDLEVRR